GSDDAPARRESPRAVGRPRDATLTRPMGGAGRVRDALERLSGRSPGPLGGPSERAIIGGMRRVRLEYGTDGIDLVTDAPHVSVIRPRFVPGLPDEAAAFREAVRRPIGACPLREVIGPRDRVAVVIPDITRPMPSDRLLPWLFAELPHVPPDRITIING